MHPSPPRAPDHLRASDRPLPLPLFPTSTRPPPTKTSSSSTAPRLATRTDMSHRLGRVVSNLSRGNHRKATDDHGLHHDESTSNNESSSNVAGGKAKLRLSVLFTGVSAWRRSDGTGRGKKNRKQQQTEETGGKRPALDIGQVVSKYLSMVERLFSSSSGGRRKKTDKSSEVRRRSHTFTFSHASGNAPLKRHKGRLSSAPASLRGSPATSGHLSVAESVKMSTSSELSTMEELQSAVQAAIAHCKNSVASRQAADAAGDDRGKC